MPMLSLFDSCSTMISKKIMDVILSRSLHSVLVYIVMFVQSNIDLRILLLIKTNYLLVLSLTDMLCIMCLPSVSSA